MCFYLHIFNNFIIFFNYNKDYIALDLLSTTLTTKWSLNPTDFLISTNETNPVFSRVYFHWWFLHVVPFFFLRMCILSHLRISLPFCCVHQPHSIILTTLTRKVSMRKYTRKHCKCDHHKIVVKTVKMTKIDHNTRILSLYLYNYFLLFYFLNNGV